MYNTRETFDMLCQEPTISNISSSVVSKIKLANLHYTIIDFNEVDIRIYLPEKVIFTEAVRPR